VGSGRLDRLVDTVRGYTDRAVSENPRIAYTRDWDRFRPLVPDQGRRAAAPRLLRME